MLVALISDIHFGARNDLLPLQSYYENFFTNVFFPTLEQNNIKHVLNLGDTFDRRKYVNFLTLGRAKEYFFDRLAYHNITMDMITGNHDAPLRNSLEMNSVRLLLNEYDNINVIDKPVSKTVDGLEICFIPWVCRDNEKECAEEIRNTKARVAMGHWPISGFVMHQGQVCEDGFDRDMFNKFEQTFSGHFHHKSTDGNIWYLGAPFEMTWQDYNDPKGFHLFDTETLELTFVRNPYTMFHRIIYDDTIEDYFTFKQYKDSYVKVVVVQKNDKVKFDRFLKDLYDVNPVSVNIVESFQEVVDSKLEEEIQEGDDTLTILEKYVDSIELKGIEPDRLKKHFRSVYLEAMNVECG